MRQRKLTEYYFDTISDLVKSATGSEQKQWNKLRSSKGIKRFNKFMSALGWNAKAIDIEDVTSKEKWGKYVHQYIETVIYGKNLIKSQNEPTLK